MDALIHNLGDKVTLKTSGETGVVTGRAEHANSEPQYLILYKSADGRQVDCWWPQSMIAPPTALTA